MTKNKDFNFKVMQISVSRYEEFCLKLDSITPEFEVFQNESICKLITKIANETFTQEIEEIITQLNNASVAISSFDIPESSRYSKEENTIYGVAAMLGVFNNIGCSNIDLTNNMPFTIHTASHSNGKRLDSIDGYIPEVKLGFHNDGLLSSEKIELPKHIALYNLHIGYNKPGNFIWLPIARWDESHKYGTTFNHFSKAVKIKLTPIYQLDKTKELVKSGFNYVKTPVSYINEDGQLHYFLNGQVLPEDNDLELVKFVQSIRDSLQNNPYKIYIPQIERRAIFISNTLGFHARDIFEDPIEGSDLSRVLLRSVDLNSELYPSMEVE